MGEKTFFITRSILSIFWPVRRGLPNKLRKLSIRPYMVMLIIMYDVFIIRVYHVFTPFSMSVLYWTSMRTRMSYARHTQRVHQTKKTIVKLFVDINNRCVIIWRVAFLRLNEVCFAMPWFLRRAICVQIQRFCASWCLFYFNNYVFFFCDHTTKSIYLFDRRVVHSSVRILTPYKYK